MTPEEEKEYLTALDNMCSHLVARGHCVICDDLADIVMFCEKCDTNGWHKYLEQTKECRCLRCQTVRGSQQTDRDFMIGI